MQLIDHDEVWQRLPLRAAIDALDAAIGRTGIPPVPARAHLSDGDTELLLMPCFEDGGAGVKLVSLDAGNPARGLPRIHGLFVLFAAPGMVPTAVIDARALTAIRTAAVSGLATRYLARTDVAQRLVVLGAGTQARAHLLAMDAVLDLADVRIVGRRRDTADALAAWARRHLDVEVTIAGPDAVADADVVCACTSSPTPVLDGTRLPDGVHVNAVGAYRPDLQELDVATVAGAQVVVETRDAAMREAGDLLAAEAAGVWDRREIRADLTEVVRDGVAVRTAREQRTLFKSVGIAYEDLVVARAVLAAG